MPDLFSLCFFLSCYYCHSKLITTFIYFTFFSFASSLFSFFSFLYSSQSPKRNSTFNYLIYLPFPSLLSLPFLYSSQTPKLTSTFIYFTFLSFVFSFLFLPLLFPNSYTYFHILLLHFSSFATFVSFPFPFLF